MPITDRQRLDAQRSHPRFVELNFALMRLKSTVSFMNSGAHPDDETSAMLATLAMRDGIDISFACANRGEGGQNDIGTETNAQLGTLRTAEMEQASRMLGLRLYWLSTHPGDSIVDSSFSKSGERTLDEWGYERSLQRFVSIVRRERPDILCPTFLDVPGQHGHHRAMTALAHAVIDKAADPHFVVDEVNEPVFPVRIVQGSESATQTDTDGKLNTTENSGSCATDQTAGKTNKYVELVNTPWQVSKLYLPAWGGGGGAYDDELLPPPATLTINASGLDQVTGWSYENIGQHSRRYHLTQGMGRWVEAGTERNWPLHLAWSCVDGPDDDLSAGLPSTLMQMAETTDNSRLTMLLSEAHELAQQTINAFPDIDIIYEHAFAMLDLIQKSRAICTHSSNGQAAARMAHRLERKEQQLARILSLCSGVQVLARTACDWWRPGMQSKLSIEKRIPNTLSKKHPSQVKVQVLASDPWKYNKDTGELSLLPHALPVNPYPDKWNLDEPDQPCVQIELIHNTTVCRFLQALEVPPVICPAVSVSIEPKKLLFNSLAATEHARTIQIGQQHPSNATVAITMPEYWHYQPTTMGLQIIPPRDVTDGLFDMPVHLDRTHAVQESRIEYSHIHPRLITTPAIVKALCAPIALPDVRVGYVGGGNDRVAYWLSAMGLSVMSLDDRQLADDGTFKSALEQLDTLVIGVFAYRMRAGLAQRAALINQWVNGGGHLLSLYHRPWDAWDPARIPPKPLTIGQPSLRYRVTDQTAVVTHLQPEHALLNTPNVITSEDWAGWKKERGLYFASAWDSAYIPLLSMADKDEEPHQGALLCGTIGSGRHIHTSLILHHQMEMLVPGSFRLMANLIS